MTFIFEEVTRPDVIRREKIMRWSIIGVIVALIAGGIGYFFLKNWTEEREVKRFLTALEQSNYQEAYRIWKPSPSYTFDSFMRDWGPNGDYGQVRSYSLKRSRSRPGGNIVEITADINGREAKFWVDRQSKSISFSPF